MSVKAESPTRAALSGGPTPAAGGSGVFSAAAPARDAMPGSRPAAGRSARAAGRFVRTADPGDFSAETLGPEDVVAGSLGGLTTETGLSLPLVRESLAGRSLAGGFLLIGWEGTDFGEAVDLVKEFRPAGLIFFKRNYPAGGGAALAEGLARIREAAREAAVEPLVIALDNEGGLVKRLPEPFCQLPKAPDYPGVEAIRRLTEISGRELANLGFDLNLAPVLDVDTVGGFMRERCLGRTPEAVIERAAAFVEGFMAAGVRCCGKHFPGLGAAVIDPHESLPTVAADAAELARVHLRPFMELLKRKVLAMVMTTHCLYPAIDPAGPATFSKAACALLRDTAGHDVVIMSDDLEMGGASGLGIGEAATAAIAAGHDLALVCRRRHNVEAAAEALGDALRRGRIPRRRLSDTRRRLAKAMGLRSPVGARRAT